MPRSCKQSCSGAANPEACGIAQLPPNCLHLVFLLLPVDTRLRCREVSVAWRDALDDVCLWTELHLSPERGVPCWTVPLLQAAVARARGQLRVLDVSGECVDFLCDELVDVVCANGGTLRELRGFENMLLSPDQLEAMAHSAPLARPLRVFVSDSDWRSKIFQLLRTPPFEHVQVVRLYFTLSGNGSEGASCAELAAWVQAHVPLQGLTVYGVRAHGSALQLIRAAAERRLRDFKLDNCTLSPTALPALTALLATGTLTRLSLCNCAALLETDAASGRFKAFCKALRCAPLQSLGLRDMRLWVDMKIGQALLSALTAHKTLTVLDVNCNDAGVAARNRAVGAALGAFVKNTPGLRALEVHTCFFDDAGAAALFKGIAAGNELRMLDFGGNDVSVGAVRRVLLPCVRACTSLEAVLLTGSDWVTDDERSESASGYRSVSDGGSEEEASDRDPMWEVVRFVKTRFAARSAQAQ